MSKTFTNIPKPSNTNVADITPAPWILLAVKILLVVIIILLLPKLVMADPKNLLLLTSPWLVITIKILLLLIIILLLPRILTAKKGTSLYILSFLQ